MNVRLHKKDDKTITISLDDKREFFTDVLDSRWQPCLTERKHQCFLNENLLETKSIH
jgi:hypothetical protein